MSATRLLRLTEWNLRAWWRGWYAWAVGALFFFMGWQSARYLTEFAASVPTAPNVWDAFFLTFMGPDAWSAVPFAMLPWFVSHLLFFYLIGDLANGELQQSGYAVVPLVGSRVRWWWGKIDTLLVITNGYTLLSLLAALLGGAVAVPWAGHASPLVSQNLQLPEVLSAIALLGWTFLLLGSTLFAMATLQLLLSILWRRSSYGFAAISIVAILSWLMGIGNPNLARWLPGSQSMLLRHTAFDPTVPGFSLEGSLLYNTVFALMMMSLGARYVCQMDLFGPLTAEIR